MALLQRPVPPARQLRLRVEAKKPTVHAKLADKNRKGSTGIKVNLELLYTDPEYKPKRQIGSVELQNGNGYRTGIVTTSTVATSDLLLVSEPVVHMEAALGTPLRPQDLLGALQGRQLSAADSFRLAVLNHGHKDSTRPLSSLDQLLDAEGHIAREAARAKKEAAAKRGFGAPAGGATGARQEPTGSHVNPAQLEAIVKLNAWGEEHRDITATACRGEEQAGFIGIWPELAVINHSCTPNSVAVTIGNLVLVRTTKALPRGAEVTVSHLDDLVFAPLQARRQALQAAYGFKCQCTRCQMEESQPPEVQQQLQSIWERLSAGENFLQLRARLAVVKKDKKELAAIAAEVQPWTDGLEAVMKEANVPPQAQVCLKASVYGAYEILAVCRDAGEEMDPKHPGSLVNLASVVAAGSDRHLCLAVEQLVRAGMISKEGPDTQQAALECILAHKLRYGMVPDAMFTRLVAARHDAPHYMGRYSFDGTGSSPAAPLPTAAAAAASAAVQAAAAVPAAAAAAGVEAQQPVATA